VRLAFNILFLVVINICYANPIGGFISYHTIGSDSIKVELNLYGRYDYNNNLPSTSSFFQVHNDKGQSKVIKDLKYLYLQKNISSRCVDSLNTITRSGNIHGIYEVKCTAIIDLNNSYYGFLKASDKIHFVYDYTVRRFFIKTTYYRGKAIGNQSVQTDENPISLVNVNQPVRGYGQFKNPDTDSMAYSLSKRLLTLTSFVENDIDYNEPVQCYFPTAVKGAPQPRNKPPIGFYLDPTSGDLTFTPTKAQSSTYVIEAKEYRKDSTGNYQLISSSILQMALYVRRLASSLPTLVVGDELKICQESPVPSPLYLRYPIEYNPLTNSFDKTHKWLPPSTSKIRLEEQQKETKNNETTRRFNVLYNNDENDDYSSFSVDLRIIQTSFCFGFNVASRTVNIIPVPEPKRLVQIDSLGCGKYALNLVSDKDVEMEYEIQTKLTLEGSSNSATEQLKDTFSIHESGVTTIRYKFNSRCCIYYSNDTVNLLPEDTYKLPLETTKALCKKDSIPLLTDSNWQHSVWNTGDTTSFIWVKDTGTFKVELMDNCLNTYAVSYVVQPNPETNIKDSTICIGDTIVLSPAPNQRILTYRPNPFIMHPDTYYVSIYDSACAIIINDSFKVQYHQPKSYISKSDSILQCDDELLTLTAQKDTSENLVWPNGTNGLSYTTDRPGWLKVNIEGVCDNFMDSVLIFSQSSPEIIMAQDTAFCSGNTIELSANTRSSTDSIWWTPSNSASKKISVSSGGTYYFHAYSLCAEVLDSVNAVEFTSPKVNLGQDTAINKYDIITLRNQTPSRFATYLWNIGSNADSLQVRLAGDYWLQETNACGTDSDTINVRYTVGVKDLEDRGFKLYPNPASDFFTIYAESAELVTYTLYDATGKAVLPTQTFVNQLRVETSNLPAGIYRVILTQDQKQVVSTIIVQ
jgi:hypothetical protein